MLLLIGYVYAELEAGQTQEGRYIYRKLNHIVEFQRCLGALANSMLRVSITSLATLEISANWNALFIFHCCLMLAMHSRTVRTTDRSRRTLQKRSHSHPCRINSY